MQKTRGAKRIRALDRGLVVIEHLSRHGLTTLRELRAATGLSNATLLRVLMTLQDRGWVRRNIVEGQFELAHSLGALLGPNARANPLAELAAPILLEMPQLRMGLPSDLCCLMAPGKIEVIESTRLRGPMAPSRTALGIRPSMVLSAHGQAILAHASAQELKTHMTALDQFGNKQEKLEISSGAFEDELNRTRARGYGLRPLDYWVTAAFEPGPDLGAIAVPIQSASGIHGSLSLLWIRADKTLQDVLDLDSLNGLRRAAERIGSALDNAGQKAPSFAH